MTHARELGHLEPPPDYTPEPSEELKRAESTLRTYRLSPEEAAKYPPVRPTRQDFRTAADQGWTPDQFAETYGETPQRRDWLRRSFRTYLDARRGRQLRGEEPGETPVTPTAPGAWPGQPAQTNPSRQEWLDRIRAALRERPDATMQQVADALDTTPGVLKNALNRSCTTLTDVRAQVQRELAAMPPPKKPQEVTDDMQVQRQRQRRGPAAREAFLQRVLTVLREHPDWTASQIGEALGLAGKSISSRLNYYGTRLDWQRQQVRREARKATAPANSPAAEPAAEPASPQPPAPPIEPAGPVIDPDAEPEAPAQPDVHRGHPMPGYETDSETVPQPDSSAESVDGAETPKAAAADWEPITCVGCGRHPDDCDRAGDCQYSGQHGAEPSPGPQHREGFVPGTVEHLVVNSICGACVKRDVCRYLDVLAEWIARVDGPVEVAIDIEYDVVVRRCEAYREEGAA